MCLRRHVLARERSARREVVFNIWTHCSRCRRGFGDLPTRLLRLTLESCGSTAPSDSARSSRTARRVEDDVYIGPYAVIGSANSAGMSDWHAREPAQRNHQQLGDDGKWRLDTAWGESRSPARGLAKVLVMRRGEGRSWPRVPWFVAGGRGRSPPATPRGSCVTSGRGAGRRRGQPEERRRIGRRSSH